MVIGFCEGEAEGIGVIGFIEGDDDGSTVDGDVLGECVGFNVDGELLGCFVSTSTVGLPVGDHCVNRLKVGCSVVGLKVGDSDLSQSNSSQHFSSVLKRYPVAIESSSIQLG